MYVKAEKCKFPSSPVSFLGFGVAQGTLQMDPAKVSEICKQLQHLLTLSLYLRLRHAGSSTSLKVLFSWTPATNQAFVSSKAPFISAPVLNFPDPERQFRVEVDASNVGVGRVLSTYLDTSPLFPQTTSILTLQGWTKSVALCLRPACPCQVQQVGTTT